MALDLSNLRQMPGLAHRPNFPRDLHILLLDPDYKARQEAEAQLRENHYSVTPCSSSVEAAAFLANPENSCDIVLADVRCLQQKSAELSAVVYAAKSIPLVLMSDSGAPSEVMLGIKLGAVDFLDKPLSPLKLKNIWQHLVRRLLTASAGLPSQNKKSAAASGTASPEDSGSHGLGLGSGSHSHGSGGESGSNASTSDQAPVKMDCEADMETSSFKDGRGGDASLAASGRTCDAAGMAMAAGGSGSGFAPAQTALAASAGCDAMQTDLPANSGAAAAATGLGPLCPKARPTAHKYKVNRMSGPVSASGGACSSGGGSAAPKPAIGYPAGQMPPLPAGVQGIEWGLPTNPLQISPKGPVGGMVGPMGWPGSALMPPPSMFSPLFSMASPSASMGSMGAPGVCGPPMHMSASCMTLSSAGAGGFGGGGGGAVCMKRAESAPLPALSCISNASAATTGLAALSGEHLMPPPPPRAPGGGVGGSCDPGSGIDSSDLFQGFELQGRLPPIGLQLKKSPSLLDFISQTLDGATILC
ncbi:hypothetical protein GPECTOR_22g896 [Gonium pectorale]|uniref:Response regulatory domain-containing protein n=1 Tax=Gonium pectorale TaxID=33097 RepID=A0A150GHH4_GONPE|nr:hypothetical protein GPECTOR_22g896 [Gonium pectorale]|eukprot:KXZ49302.1 hypothetical protein GPECTOR_22g896 [Gonium pectorale]